MAASNDSLRLLFVVVLVLLAIQMGLSSLGIQPGGPSK
jgi:hypothetical protein